MKKAQMNQAFTYIAIILIIGVIAVFGTKAILGIFNANCESKNVEFASKLERFIVDYSDKGSVITESLALPCDVSEVCFVSASKLVDEMPFYVAGFDLDATENSPVIKSSVEDGSYNVFVKSDFVRPILKVEKLEAPGDDGILCIKASTSYMRLRFSGKGRTTLVEQG